MPSETDQDPLANQEADNVAKISTQDRDMPISRNLARLVDQLRSEFPTAEQISFEYTDRLRLHIDVRTLEEANVIEARLPALCSGMFSNHRIGSSPNHNFFHRVTARAEA